MRNLRGTGLNYTEIQKVSIVRTDTGIEAAGGADPVGNVRGGTLRTGAPFHLRQGQVAVVGAPHPLAAVRRLAFGYSHKFSFKTSVCSIPTRPTNLASGWRFLFVWRFYLPDWAVRRNRLHTTDVAETPAEYLPGGKASSPAYRL